MPDIRQVSEKRVDLVFALDGDEYRIQYRPYRQALLNDILKQASAFAAQVEDGDLSGFDEQDRGTILFLREVLTDWDMTDGGQPIPLTSAGLASIPVHVLNVMQAEVQADVTLGNDRKKRSRYFLKRTVGPGNAPAGTATSSPPTA